MVALGALILIVVAAAVIRAKRISPLGWGWYGNVQTTNGQALHGYDAVAYHAGVAVRGDPAHTLQWHDAEWRFTSGENRALFEADPARYAPQFGGFCAYASSKGFTASVDPTAFRIEGGRLYLFNDASMRDKWIAELPDGVISRAQERWKGRH